MLVTMKTLYGRIKFPKGQRSNYKINNKDGKYEKYQFINTSYNKKRYIQLINDDGGFENLWFDKFHKMGNGKELILLQNQHVKINITTNNNYTNIHSIENINRDKIYIDNMPKKGYKVHQEYRLLALQELQTTLGIRDHNLTNIIDYLDLPKFYAEKNHLSFGIDIGKQRRHNWVSLKTIRNNPYVLLTLDKFGIKTINQIADYLEIPENDSNRLYYNLIYGVNGSLIPQHKLDLIDQNLIDQLVKEKTINLKREIIERIENEKKLACIISGFLTKRKIKLKYDRPYLKKILEKKQLKALHKATKYNFLMLNGNGGTGKSYTLCKIIDMITINNKSVIITSITHKALAQYKKNYINDKIVNNQGNITIQVCAGILHGYCEQTCDTLIIDEISMYGVEDLLCTLGKIKFNSLILVGDPQQLPSISYGNVLEDLRNNIKKTFKVKLKVQKRSMNDINTHIHKLISKNNNGNHKYIPFFNKNITNLQDGIYKLALDSSDDKRNIKTILTIYNELIIKYGIENTSIITYKNKTVDDINKAISESNKEIFYNKFNKINKPDEQKNHMDNMMKFKKNIYLKGDKIKFTSNNKKLYSNNQFGIIQKFYYHDHDHDNDGDGDYESGYYAMIKSNNHNIDFCKFDDITHAWCSTCHSYQGSESEAVIVFCDSMSDIKWLYTALSRGKKFVIIIYTNNKTCSGDNFTNSLLRNPKRETTLNTQLKNILSEDKITINENILQSPKINKPEKKPKKIILSKRKKYNPIERERSWKKWFGDKNTIKCPNCSYCEITMLRFEMGHIEAHIKGGSSELDNIAPLCSTCNKSMGSKSINMVKYKKNLIKITKGIGHDDKKHKDKRVKKNKK